MPSHNGIQCTCHHPTGKDALHESHADLTTQTWVSCCMLPHCLGAAGRGPPASHCRSAWGQWAVDVLLFTTALPCGSAQRISGCLLPHCLGAVGSGSPAEHCLTTRGQWAVELLQDTAALPGGSGQWNSCGTLPHCLGQWAVDLLLHRRTALWHSPLFPTRSLLQDPAQCHALHYCSPGAPLAPRHKTYRCYVLRLSLHQFVPPFLNSETVVAQGHGTQCFVHSNRSNEHANEQHFVAVD